MNEFLIKRGYKIYPDKVNPPYVLKNLYEQRLTELETKVVCETNDRLCIHIQEYQFTDGPKQYSIAIKAERLGIWWDLQAYSLFENEMVSKIEFIENELIKMFNAI